MSEHGEGVSPSSTPKMFTGLHMSGPGREGDERIPPNFVQRSVANAEVAVQLDPGKRRRADDCVECDFSTAALIKKAKDTLELR